MMLCLGGSELFRAEPIRTITTAFYEGLVKYSWMLVGRLSTCPTGFLAKHR